MRADLRTGAVVPPAEALLILRGAMVSALDARSDGSALLLFHKSLRRRLLCGFDAQRRLVAVADLRLLGDEMLGDDSLNADSGC